jgi:hypothetical protein
MVTSSPTFIGKLAGQPQARRRLVAAYTNRDGRARLTAVWAAPLALLLGMGVSYRAALIGARRLRLYGIHALACEAAEAILGEVGQRVYRP